VNHLNGFKILPPSKFPISFIHLAHTSLHIKGLEHPFKQSPPNMVVVINFKVIYQYK